MADWIHSNADVLSVVATLLVAAFGTFVAEGGWRRRQLRRIAETVEASQSLRKVGMDHRANELEDEARQQATRYAQREARLWGRASFGSFLCLLASFGLVVFDRRFSDRALATLVLGLIGALGSICWWLVAAVKREARQHDRD